MIDVALTPADLRAAEVAVVIDVLRASTTVTQALSAGYGRVLCTDSVERALGLRAPGRVLAGERECVKPAGFDQGNSPLEAARRQGDELVLATTNGAPAIVAATAHAPRVLLACLLNLGAAVGVLRDADGDVTLVCSGTGGLVALEDVYVAGRIAAALSGERTDAALVAQAVARGFETALPALAASADAAALRAAGLEADIEYCARESELALVPHVVSASEGVATVEAGAGVVGAAAVDAADTVQP